MQIMILSVLLILLNGISNAQNSLKSDCSIMKSGKFKYLEAQDTSAFFEITDTSHTEYYNNGKYYIKSEMSWISDCQYSMKMLENTIPEFPFKPGDVMLVTIKRVDNDIIFFTSEVNGMKWDGKVRKLDHALRNKL